METHEAHGQIARPNRWLGEDPGARRRALGLFVFFFLVIAAFWVQKPIRTSRFLTAVGPEYLPLVKLGTALLVLPVVLLYSSLAARFRRAALVDLCVATFATASLIFWWVFSRGDGGGGAWASYAYFFYLDIFNSVMVAVFWSVANDLNTPEEARRSYGVVGAGGIVGGIAGSALTGWGVAHLGAPNLLLVCVAILVAIAVVAHLLAGGHDAGDARPTPDRAQPTVREALAGARLVVGSRYLMAIALVVVAYEIVSNVVDYQFNTVVAAQYRSEAAIAAFLGRFSTASNAASLLVQLGLTTWILRRWGPRVGLLVLPIVLGVGSAGFLAVPTFAVVATAFFSDAALGYSLNQSSKEVLYTPTDEATKYQAKAFIDMFLMRLAKGLSALLIMGSMAWWVPSAPAAVRWLGVVSLAVVAVWIAVAYAAARSFSRQTGPEPEASAAAPPARAAVGAPHPSGARG